MPRPSASCDVYIDDVLLPCTRQDLAAGEITILDDLTINWGRTSRWDQPDPGTASFRLHDQRTNPIPIVDKIHAGSKVDIFAKAPNPNPQPQVQQQNFQSFNPVNDWTLDPTSASIRRTNRATDPAFTTTAGKTAGGSASLAIVASGDPNNPQYLTITPNGVSNLSAVFPGGGTGMTFFEANRTHTVSVYYRLNVVQTGTLNVDARKIRLHRATGGATTIVATSAQGANIAGSWQRLSLTFTLPADTTQAIISVCNGSSIAGQVMDVDNLLVQRSSTLDSYFDGGTPDTAAYDYEWTGPANASTSTETYKATLPTSTVTIYNSSSAPVGQGTLSAALNTGGTRGAFWFPMDGWGEPWLRRGLRPIHPGETWNYSFMVRAKAGGEVSVNTRGMRSPSPIQYQYQTLRMSGAADQINLEIVGTGNWETYTGTLTNIWDIPLWPIFRILIFPNSVDGLFVPAVDAITYTAPAQTELNVQVWAGRVSDVEIIPAARGSIDISVAAVGEAAQGDNVTVGDTPWPLQLINNRIDRIIAAIPPDLTGISVSRDSLDLIQLRARDVDLQPARALIAQTAGYDLAVTWPMSAPGMRNHLWIEDHRDRTWPPQFGTPAGTISACNVDKNKIRIGQSIDQVITVAEVTWIRQEIGPAPDFDISYVETIARTTDMAAVDIYGTQTMRLSTEIAAEASALSLGASIVDIARASDWYLQGMEFNTRDLRFADSDPAGLAAAQALLMLLLNSTQRPACAITITDLTEWFPISMASGYLEGGVIQYIDGWWRFELTLTSGDYEP